MNNITSFFIIIHAKRRRGRFAIKLEESSLAFV